MRVISSMFLDRPVFRWPQLVILYEKEKGRKSHRPFDLLLLLYQFVNVAFSIDLLSISLLEI